MAWHGMVYQCVYSLSFSLSIRKMYGCEAYGGYNCSGSSRKMDGIHIYKMLVRLSLYRTMPSPRQRQRQRQRHRNICIRWWFTSYERCIHIHAHTFVSYNNNNNNNLYVRIFYLILRMCALLLNTQCMLVFFLHIFQFDFVLIFLTCS